MRLYFKLNVHIELFSCQQPMNGINALAGMLEGMALNHNIFDPYNLRSIISVLQFRIVNAIVSLQWYPCICAYGNSQSFCNCNFFSRIRSPQALSVYKLPIILFFFLESHSQLGDVLKSPLPSKSETGIKYHCIYIGTVVVWALIRTTLYVDNLVPHACIIQARCLIHFKSTVILIAKQ